MNTGESLFSIGALLLLSLTILRVNNNVLITDSMLYDSKIGIMANSISTSLSERALQENFDQNAVGATVDYTYQLSLPLGPENSGEKDPNTFNDFDDFNNYVDTTMYGSTAFISRCEVKYVNTTGANIDNIVNYQTWHKMMTVYVTWRDGGQIIGTRADTIKQSTVYSYWYFY